MITMEWTDRQCRGPAKEFMNRAEFRALFAISDEFLDQLLHAHILPQPRRPTKRTVFYTWQHAVLLSMWIKLGGSLPNEGETTDGNLSGS